MRPAFFMAYDEANCEFVKLASQDIDKRLKGGPEMVSANFVIPYPPGLPNHGAGPGDHEETITFMRKLDVKEIHGYHAAQGLKLLKPDVLARAQEERRQPCLSGSPRRFRQYPEIAIFLSLGLGYYFGKFTFKGIGLGSVTATLLAGVIIGQIGITINQPLKAFAFLMFLFAVGYGVGPQFVRGVAKDGLPQAIFAVVQCLFCLIVPVAIAKMAGYDLGYAAGLYSGSQTISAAMGLSTDAINRLGLPADQAKALLDTMPIAYAVTYMFGTVGSAIVIALVCPALLRIDLVAACKEYEEMQGGTAAEMGGAGSAWHKWELRAFKRAGGREGRRTPGRRGRGSGPRRARLRGADPPTTGPSRRRPPTP